MAVVAMFIGGLTMVISMIYFIVTTMIRESSNSQKQMGYSMIGLLVGGFILIVGLFGLIFSSGI